MGDSAFKEYLREELLDGKVVAMSPRPVVNHTVVSGNIHNIFKNHLRGKPCDAFGYGVDVHLTEKDTVIPDVMIICNKDIVKRTGIYGTPDLIVEVLSPSTAKKDRGYKKALYGQCGVKEYWIVDIENRAIEVYLLNGKELDLDEIYVIFPDYLIEKMTDEEKHDIKYEFKTSLFSDMIINIEEVFEGLY